MHALQWPHHTRHAASKYSSGQGSAAAQATRQAEKCMLMLPAMSAEVWVWVVFRGLTVHGCKGMYSVSGWVMQRWRLVTSAGACAVRCCSASAAATGRCLNDYP